MLDWIQPVNVFTGWISILLMKLMPGSDRSMVGLKMLNQTWMRCSTCILLRKTTPIRRLKKFRLPTFHTFESFIVCCYRCGIDNFKLWDSSKCLKNLKLLTEVNFFITWVRWDKSLWNLLYHLSSRSMLLELVWSNFSKILRWRQQSLIIGLTMLNGMVFQTMRVDLLLKHLLDGFNYFTSMPKVSLMILKGKWKLRFTLSIKSKTRFNGLWTILLCIVTLRLILGLCKLRHPW